METTLSKKWASNDTAFLQAKTTQIENMLKQSEHISHNIEFVCPQLRNRFDMASVNENERKRKAKKSKSKGRKTRKREVLLKNLRWTVLNLPMTAQLMRTLMLLIF